MLLQKLIYKFTNIIFTISFFELIALFSIAHATAGIQRRQRYFSSYSKLKITCSWVSHVREAGILVSNGLLIYISPLLLNCHRSSIRSMSSDSESSCFKSPNLKLPARHKLANVRDKMLSSTESLDSLRSTQESSATTPDNIKKLIQQCKRITTSISNDSKSTLSAQAASSVVELEKIYTNIFNLNSKNKRLIQSLVTSNKGNEAKIEEHYDQRYCFTSNIPKPDTIHNSIQDALAQHMEALDDKLNEIVTLKHSIQAMVPTPSIPSADNSIQPIPSTSVSNTPLTHPDTPQNPSTYNTDAQNPTNRTISILPKQRDRFLSGQSIKQDLLQKRLSYSSAVVQHITAKRSHLEIVCRTAEESMALAKDLQKDPSVNIHFNVISKRIPQQKIILLNVPINTSQEFIKDCISTLLRVHTKDVQILKSSPAKTDNAINWIILLPIPQAKNLVYQGDIYIGLARCLARPFTSVLRCRRCQAFGHTTKACKFEENCDNCGNSHGDSDCSDAPHCINCNSHNNQHGTVFATNHKASENICPTFKLYYCNERQRLDTAFPSSKKSSLNKSAQQAQSAWNLSPPYPPPYPPLDPSPYPSPHPSPHPPPPPPSPLFWDFPLPHQGLLPLHPWPPVWSPPLYSGLSSFYH